MTSPVRIISPGYYLSLDSPQVAYWHKCSDFSGRSARLNSEKHEELIRALQTEVSGLRNELTTVRVEAAEKLASSAKATLEAFNEAATQRASVARLIDVNREEMDSLNARTVSLMADMKAVKEASENFKFAREKDDELIRRAGVSGYTRAQRELRLMCGLAGREGPLHTQGRRVASQFLARTVVSITLSSRAVT